MSKKVITFDKWKQGIFLVSSDGYIIGKENKEQTVLVSFIPENFNVVAADLIASDSDVSLTGFTVNFGDRLRFSKQAQFIQIQDYDPDVLEGIIDVKLTKKAVTTGTATLFAKVDCSEENLAEYYASEIATPACWKIVSSTGTAITVTSATVNAADNSITLSFTGTAASVSMASISVLKQNGIDGYESNTLTL